MIARRRSKRGLEYLVSWEGYNQFGDTWGLPDGLPPHEIAKFEAFRKPMPSSIELVLTAMRDKIAPKLLPRIPKKCLAIAQKMEPSHRATANTAESRPCVSETQPFSVFDALGIL